ncbi:MAG: HIT domain-containing protein [Bacteriovorax sp.]
MKAFRVDPELEKNSYLIADLALSRLYVKNDKENPWFILVPRVANASELIDLNHEEQCMLMEEVTIVSDFLRNYYQPFKINIGALGNIVRQLHVHVLARYEDDRAWPQALWGTEPSLHFEQVELENIKSNFQEYLE